MTTLSPVRPLAASAASPGMPSLRRGDMEVLLALECHANRGLPLRELRNALADRENRLLEVVLGSRPRVVRSLSRLSRAGFVEDLGQRWRVTSAGYDAATAIHYAELSTRVAA